MADDIETFVPRQRLQQERARQQEAQRVREAQQGLGGIGGLGGMEGPAGDGAPGGAPGAPPSPEEQEAMMQQMGAYLEMLEKEQPEQFAKIMGELMSQQQQPPDGADGEGGASGLSDELLQELMRGGAGMAGADGDPGAGPLNMPSKKGGMRMGKAGLEEEHAGVDITPLPGFVMKTTRLSDGRKVFINICQSCELQAPSLKKKLDDEGNEQEGTNIPLSLGPAAEDVDKAGAVAVVYDCIVNTKVIDDADADATGQFRNFICELALNYVEQKFKQPLNHRYKLPKLKYKGDKCRPQRVRASVAPTIQEVGAEGAEAAPPMPGQPQRRQQGGRGAGAKPTKPKRRAPTTQQYVKTMLLCNDGDGSPDRPLDEEVKPAVEGGAVHLPVAELTPAAAAARRDTWPAQLVFRADFSGAEVPLTAAEVKVEVNAELLSVSAPGFHVCDLFLPYPVRDAEASASFDTERGALAVVAPVDAEVATVGAGPDLGSAQWVLASALSEGSGDRESKKKKEEAEAEKPQSAAEKFHLQVPKATEDAECSKDHFENEVFPEDRFHSQDVMSQQILANRKKEREDKNRKADEERRERHRAAGRTDEQYDDTFVMEETCIGADGKEETKFVDLRPKEEPAPSLVEAVTEEEKSAAAAAKAVADIWARDTKQDVALSSSGLAFELLD